jgi:hypothetical protein
MNIHIKEWVTENIIKNSEYSVQLVFLLWECNLTIFIRIGTLYIICVLVYITAL